jgi:mRNA interferase MazF
MNKLNFGDIVLIKFPFSDGLSFKKRPALVINDMDDGDIIVCRITSQIYKSDYDIYLETWKESGLRLPSVIRVHKLATLSKDMVETIMGRIDNSHKIKIKHLISMIAK